MLTPGHGSAKGMVPRPLAQSGCLPSQNINRIYSAALRRPPLPFEGPCLAGAGHATGAQRCGWAAHSAGLSSCRCSSLTEALASALALEKCHWRELKAVKNHPVAGQLAIGNTHTRLKRDEQA